MADMDAVRNDAVDISRQLFEDRPFFFSEYCRSTGTLDDECPVFNRKLARELLLTFDGKTDADFYKTVAYRSIAELLVLTQSAPNSNEDYFDVFEELMTVFWGATKCLEQNSNDVAKRDYVELLADPWFMLCAISMEGMLSMPNGILGNNTLTQRLLYEVAFFHEMYMLIPAINCNFNELIKKEPILLRDCVLYALKRRLLNKCGPQIQKMDLDILRNLLNNHYNFNFLRLMLDSFDIPNAFTLFLTKTYCALNKSWTRRRRLNIFDTIIYTLMTKKDTSGAIDLLRCILRKTRVVELEKLLEKSSLIKLIDSGEPIFLYNMENYFIPAIVEIYRSCFFYLVPIINQQLHVLVPALVTVAQKTGVVNVENDQRFQWKIIHMMPNLPLVAASKLLAVLMTIRSGKDHQRTFQSLQYYMDQVPYSVLCTETFLIHLCNYLKTWPECTEEVRKNNRVDDIINYKKMTKYFLDYALDMALSDNLLSNERAFFAVMYRTIIARCTGFNPINYAFYNIEYNLGDKTQLGRMRTEAINAFFSELSNADTDLPFDDDVLQHRLNTVLKFKTFAEVAGIITDKVRLGMKLLLDEMAKNSAPDELGQRPVVKTALFMPLTLYRMMCCKLDSEREKLGACPELGLSQVEIADFIYAAVPVQTEDDPNIFVNMDKQLELSVLEALKVLNVVTNMRAHDDEEDYFILRRFPFINACEHLLEYSPSKRLLCDVTELHQGTFKCQCSKAHPFANFIKEYTSEHFAMVVDSKSLVRRSMRRHPYVSAIFRNIVILCDFYKSDALFSLQTNLFNFTTEMDPKDIAFKLAVEVQLQIFECTQMKFNNLRHLEDITMNILLLINSTKLWSDALPMTYLNNALVQRIASCGEPRPHFRYPRLTTVVTTLLSGYPNNDYITTECFKVLGCLRVQSVTDEVRQRLSTFSKRHTQLGKDAAELVNVLRLLPGVPKAQIFM